MDYRNHNFLKFLELKTGYPIAQINGQRRFGPPPDWVGPPPPKGCEVFIGKLPRDIFEDELVPLFSRVGKIYELRLMMDFSGSNRGYAFVTYSTRTEAAAAVRQLNGFELRPRRQIGVVKSVDNCRLFIGNLPKNKTKEEVSVELMKRVGGIVDVILYKNCFDRKLNRGFAFVEFQSHRAAAMARRELVPGCVKLWDKELLVNWAEPEPDVEDDLMRKVKVLYARNFEIKTTPDTIQKVFEKAIDKKIERVKKIYDYAFIHFFEREHAEVALAKLQNSEIEGSCIEIRWAKPVDRELYRIQKMNRGNAKFNNSLNLTQTMMLYNKHLDQKEYAKSPRDEGIGSTCADSPSYSPANMKPVMVPCTQLDIALSRLEAMCIRYMWSLPIYSYQKVIEGGQQFWLCSVELPHVGLPLFSVPQRIGPLITRCCLYIQQAQIEAAEMALRSIQTTFQVNLMQQSAPQVYSPITQSCPLMPPITQSCPLMPPLQNCAMSYDYPLYQQTPSVMPVPPAVWATF